jgi:hypothetical protein
MHPSVSYGEDMNLFHQKKEKDMNLSVVEVSYVPLGPINCDTLNAQLCMYLDLSKIVLESIYIYNLATMLYRVVNESSSSELSLAQVRFMKIQV